MDLMLLSLSIEVFEFSGKISGHLKINFCLNWILWTGFCSSAVCADVIFSKQSFIS